MANSLAMNTSQPIAGLGTFAYTITSADVSGYSYVTLGITSTLPPASGLSIVIKHNGSNVVSVGGASTNPTPSQASIGTSARIQIAAADTVSVVLASSNAVDNQPNSVKSVVNLYLGE